MTLLFIPFLSLIFILKYWWDSVSGDWQTSRGSNNNTVVMKCWCWESKQNSLRKGTCYGTSSDGFSFTTWVLQMRAMICYDREVDDDVDDAGFFDLGSMRWDKPRWPAITTLFNCCRPSAKKFHVLPVSGYICQSEKQEPHMKSKLGVSSESGKGQKRV